MRGPMPILARALALQEYLRERNGQAFEWGRADCVAFALGWLRIVRPELASGLRLEHASALQAARLVRQWAGGAGGLRGAVAQKLGEPISPLLAQLGDLVLIATPREQARLAAGRKKGHLGHTLGICTGDHIALPMRAGLAYVALARREPGALDFVAGGAAAWRV